MNFFARTHPIISIGPKTMFGSDSERFGTFCMQNGAKRLRFGARMHCLRVTNFEMGFFAMDTSNPLALARNDVWQRFGRLGYLLHENRSKPESTVSATEHLMKFFARTYPITSIGPKRCSGVIWSVSVFCMQNGAKRLRFGARMHCLGVTKFGMGFSLRTLAIHSHRP